MTKVVWFDLGDTLVRPSRQWVPGAQQVLEELRRRGLRLGVLSNTGGLSRMQVFEMLPADFDLGLFEPRLIVFSSEVGVEKPSPAIFALAIDRSAVPAGECLFCSEDLTDTLAAQRSGMLAARAPSASGSGLGELIASLSALHLLDDAPPRVDRLDRTAARAARLAITSNAANRFQRVIEILNAAVGGPAAPVGAHGAFWRGLTRDQFIARKVFGMQIVTLGDGVSSTLVKAFKGEAPFGEDLPIPPPDAIYRRMPAGRPPVAPADIAFIEQWIDDGCPEDPLSVAAELQWRPTNAPIASSRTDDIWFAAPDVGWAVNSNGHILKTEDGGANWTRQLAVGAYLRCLGFAGDQVGWVGTLTPARRLYRTTDGGAHWTQVTNLPPDAPPRICGLSVVNEQVVFAAGTNIPTDTPRMMKTTDGGQSWTAWEMRPHASILIDTFFLDELRGWVVGGRADTPNPADRSRIKPVVLWTDDGGATWTNRLAGQEAVFPLGEWGWKIQFLDQRIGFVSLENFTAAAILKTSDGGLSWQRIIVNDPQGNANLEGVGFTDEQHGWVGGWGDDHFETGYTSATDDGGQSWRSANAVGKFVNRFRFFGSPVIVGYASGESVYKYSAAAVAPAPRPLRASAATPLLVDRRLDVARLPAEIRYVVPAGADRVTMDIWDRFGQHIGCLLDETRPPPGLRSLVWEGCDAQGNRVADGSYVVRLTLDDNAESGIVALGTAGARPRTTSIPALMRISPADRDLDWLKDTLAAAIKLEFATIPPYLAAYWSIKDPNDPVAKSLRTILREEMLHYGLACNLLVAVGGTPSLHTPAAAPTFPGGLPGGVHPGLTVSLRRLTRDQAKVFMDVECPQGGPIALALRDTYASIGAFYDAIAQAFDALQPPLDVSRQLAGPLGLKKLATLADVRDAIALIKTQGEGSATSPEDSGPDDLAHYYRFAEVHHGHRLILDPQSGRWSFTGPQVPLPDTWPMAEIPAGGYQRPDVPDPATWTLIEQFDQEFTGMLNGLQSAWTTGSVDPLDAAIGYMFAMRQTAKELFHKPLPTGNENYGPCFRLAASGPTAGPTE